MVRFAWRRDIGKKAKIMVSDASYRVTNLTKAFSVFRPQRKVKFANEFDAVDIVTPELKDKLIPVSRRLKEIEKERFERRKVRKRTKNAPQASAPAGESSMNVDEPAAPPTAGELEDESVYRTRELNELEALVDPELKADFGSSLTGLYDLVGESQFTSGARWIDVDGDGMFSHCDT